MTTAHVVETSVIVNNSLIQDYVHPEIILNLLMKWLLGSNLSLIVEFIGKIQIPSIFPVKEKNTDTAQKGTYSRPNLPEYW